MADKVTELLVLALKQAIAEPGDQRLFKSGKLSGLFSGRGGASGDAAAKALKDGMLEPVRTEMKGKTTVEWVRLTPRGVDFLHHHASPNQALIELRDVLKATREGLPPFVAQMQEELRAFTGRLAESVDAWTARLNTLAESVEEAIRRAELGRLENLPDGMLDSVSWALAGLAYLDRRRAQGMTDDCPLPELFAALRKDFGDLTISAFHNGLRRLFDRRVVRLKPFPGPPKEIPEPEYALLDGTTVVYYVSR